MKKLCGIVRMESNHQRARRNRRPNENSNVARVYGPIGRLELLLHCDRICGGGWPVNGLDLFSGIGGITKALQGYVRPIAYCENDRYAQGVLLSRMWTGDLPWAPISDDVRELRGVDFSSPIDIIYGGFPCQDISVAGRGAGLGGKSSILFWEIARLIGEIRPGFVFLENVPNIRTLGTGIVVGELDRLGYDCRWDILSAAEVGSEIGEGWRWYLLAKAKSHGRDETPLHPYANLESKRVARKKGRSVGYICEQDNSGNFWCFPDTCTNRTFDDVSVWVDRLGALGNSVCPPQAREAFERLMGIKSLMSDGGRR